MAKPGHFCIPFISNLSCNSDVHHVQEIVCSSVMMNSCMKAIVSIKSESEFMMIASEFFVLFSVDVIFEL